MSLPDPMPCLADQCRSPLACNGFGYCREQNMLSAREYDEALRACRDLGIRNPFADYRQPNETSGGSFR